MNLRLDIHYYLPMLMGAFRTGRTFFLLIFSARREYNLSTDTVLKFKQFDERMNLLAHFPKIFPEAQIAYICSDREFVGQQWLT